MTHSASIVGPLALWLVFPYKGHLFDAGGHKSGDWKVDDRIFEGRLRVVSIGELCELRLEETGRYFPLSPFVYLQAFCILCLTPGRPL